MKAIIPLAGFGTRLRPHTWSKPKPLLNVAGKPVLGHILDKIKELPVDEVIFIVGWLGDQIKDYVETNYNFATTRYVEQTELLGQAHAVWLAREYISGPILILFVDTLFEADLSWLETETADGVACVKEVDDPRRFGVVQLDEHGYIARFIEKPSSTDNKLVVIGLYYVREGRDLLKAIDELMARNIKTKGEFFLADAFQLMIEAGARFRVQPVEVWEDCGKPETVLHTNRYLLDHGYNRANHGTTVNSVIVPPVHIAPTVRVENSIIGPYVTLADHVVVIRSIIRDSIIDQGARIEDATLDQSLIGKHAWVRGGFRKLNVGDSSQVDFSGG